MTDAVTNIECICCGRALVLPEGLREGASFTCPACTHVSRNIPTVRTFRWEQVDPYIRRNGVSRGNLWGGLLGSLAWLVVLAVIMIVRSEFKVFDFALIALPYLAVLVVLRLTRPGRPAMLWMMQLWIGLGSYCLYLAVLKMLRTDWTKVLEVVGDISPSLLLALGGTWLGVGFVGTWIYKTGAARLPKARERMAT